ncbi:hypothetical protein ACFL9T_16810 [Thermodesulfobacteriota bacterium]
MDVKDYCKSMEMEHILWKAKLYDVLRKVDQLSDEQKGKMTAMIEALHRIVDEMGDRIESLSAECPSDWSPQKKEIDKVNTKMQSRYDAATDVFVKADIGIGW